MQHDILLLRQVVMLLTGVNNWNMTLNVMAANVEYPM